MVEKTTKSLKKNFGYNLVLTLCKYLFPLMTYPYVSRVLGVDKIGLCNFVDSIINYFVLFSTLGITSYGVREIAKCRNDLVRKNKVFSNLLAINFIGTILAIVVLVACTLCVPALLVYQKYLWVGIGKLFFEMFLIEWFFQGIQEFKYITIRSIVVRFVYVACVFIFVHTENDALIYFTLNVVVVVLNAACNWLYSKRFITFSLKSLNIRTYLIPVLIFGYYRLLTYMYTTFNTVFLGFCSGDREVGFFTTATKLYSIIMALFTTFTTVMVPKVSELLAEGKKEELQRIANQTFSLLSVIAFPIIISCLFYANEIILLIAGSGYEGANPVFRIVILLLLIIGVEQIVIQQFLMASSSNKSIFAVSTTGAIVGIVMNILVTSRLGAVGSALAWGVSEISVLFVGIILLNKYMGIKIHLKPFVSAFFSSLLYIPIPLICKTMWDFPLFFSLAIMVMNFILFFFVINLKVSKNGFILDFVKKMRIRRGKF